MGSPPRKLSSWMASMAHVICSSLVDFSPATKQKLSNVYASIGHHNLLNCWLFSVLSLHGICFLYCGLIQLNSLFSWHSHPGCAEECGWKRFWATGWTCWYLVSKTVIIIAALWRNVFFSVSDTWHKHSQTREAGSQESLFPVRTVHSSFLCWENCASSNTAAARSQH